MTPSLFDRLKVPFFVVVFIFACLFIFTKLFGPIPFYINNVTTNKSDLFTVDGSGQTTAVPSTAQVSLGITKSATTVQDAQKQVNQIANTLTADLKSLGIADKDIKTTDYSSYPSYVPPIQPIIEQSNTSSSGTAGSAIALPIRPPTTQQYTVTETMQVTTDATDTANKVLDLATKDGANTVGGITFVLTDAKQQELESTARTLAIKNAKQKASDIANAAGIHLGRIVNIQESTSGFPGPIMFNGAKNAAPDQNTQTTLNPGENKITVNVTLSYETY